jgi:hypothetical protein
MSVSVKTQGETIADFTKATSLDPADAVTYYNRGINILKKDLS